MSLVGKKKDMEVYHPPPVKQKAVVNNSNKYNDPPSSSSSGVKENPAACIFVASLNKNVEDDVLNASVFNHFRQWGKLLGVKVLKDWLRRPYAFVQYESEQDSKKALKEAPGTLINNRHIRCEPARVNRSICLISFNQPFNKTFLQSHLSVFGDIEDITILQPHGKFHYVFIKYKYREDAIKAYLALRCSDLDNKNHWFVEWASNLDINNMYGGVCGNIISRSLDRTSLFVGNLHESTTEKDLRGEFGLHGTILNVHVIRKPLHHQHKRVFAFIKYENEAEAARAIDYENGKFWKDKVIRVCYREYFHNSTTSCAYVPTTNATTTAAAAALPYYYYCNNNKQQASYPSMKEPQQQQYNKLSQQIMTEDISNNPYFFMPYCNPAATTTTTTIYDPNSYAYMANSGIISSPEKSSLNNNMTPHHPATTAGAFYTINSKDNLYNTPPSSLSSYYIADPYSTSTALVYYPYPQQAAQTFYYNGSGSNGVCGNNITNNKKLVKNIGTNKDTSSGNGVTPA